MMSDVADAPLRMLVVDDDPEFLRAVARGLRASGHEVDVVGLGHGAVTRIRQASYDVVLSDIALPDLDGIALLRLLRARDVQVPVVLVTGQPSFDTAVRALELGAFRYLTKPVATDELERTVVAAGRAHRATLVKKTELEPTAPTEEDEARLSADFRRALDTLWMAYQPIVDADTETVYAFEALLRTDEPSLSHPTLVLDAAERLGTLGDVGKQVRARTAADLTNSMSGTLLFVNLHVADLLDDELFDEDAPLSRHASQVVLEVTERGSLSRISDVRSRVAELRALGFRIALDDLGAGYAGLNSFALLEPDFVKLDMDLVRGVHLSRTKRKIIRAIVSLAADMGMLVVAEGIASVSEKKAVQGLGCNLLQGYFLGEPAHPASSRPAGGLPPPGTARSS